MRYLKTALSYGAALMAAFAQAQTEVPASDPDTVPIDKNFKPDIATMSFEDYLHAGSNRAYWSQAVALAKEQNAEADKRSDIAWEKALPTVLAGNKNGKPYIPWAAKPSDLPQAKIPAFPGAEGGGMYSFGGRGGRVIIVTNLNDSGPGSFRAAVEEAGPRIVVFNVAGIIHLKEHVRIRAPYITIAGNTAPGDGVCVAGEVVQIDTHDVVIRHMRFRRGDTWMGDFEDALGGNAIGNIIIDHISCSWALDENLSIYRHMYTPPEGGAARKLPTVNITIQNSIISESLVKNGSTIGGHNATFHRNLWACNEGRNPSVGMDGDFTFVNNVLYNWGGRSVDGGDEKSAYTFINNYYKPGPMTPTAHEVGFRLLKAEAKRSTPPRDEFGKAYVAGNILEGNERITADNWDGGVQITPALPDSDKTALLAALRVDKPFNHAPVTIMPAKQAFAHVLANSGALLPRRDAVDQRVVEMTRTGTVTFGKGAVRSVDQVGGYPDYKGTPHTDSDNDGMPDDWEKQHGLNPRDASDASHDSNDDGYTNIEDYLNGLDPRAPKKDWTDLNNNRDPRAVAAAKE